MPKNLNPTNLVWIDLETTGIDVDTNAILEIATIVTDKELNVLEEGPDLIVHQPDAVLETMDAWCVKQHGNSGLTEAVKKSSISLKEAERRTLEFVARYCPPSACPLCGNSICFDRRFIMRYMPGLNAHLSYRNVDVSSIKELAYRWYPRATKKLAKESSHRAMDDIRESLEELRLYRKTLFKEPDA